MVLALALVVVVIGAAAKPEFYEPFFDAEGQDSSVMNLAPSHLDPSSTNETSIVIPEEVRRKSVELAAALSADQQVSVARSLIRYQNGERDESMVAELNQVLVSDDRVQIEAMIQALVAEAQKRVVDGAVWRSGDRDALRLRLLRSQQSLIHVHTAPAAVVGVLSLLQQPDVFRGQTVRILGQIARVELVSEGSSKSDPLPEYWQIWIRPSSGADRPVVAIVTSLSDEIKDFEEGGADADAPRVMVQGTFLKRLAYRSSLGADLAPVVVGRLLQRTPPSVASKDDRKVDVIGPIVVVAAAIGIGVLLAGGVIWRTAASAKHTRRLRRDREVAALDVLSDFEDNLASPEYEQSKASS